MVGGVWALPALAAEPESSPAVRASTLPAAASLPAAALPESAAVVPPEETSATRKRGDIHWDPRWRKADVGDGLSLALFAAYAGSMKLIISPVPPRRWYRTNVMDEALRDALRFSRGRHRENSRMASDWLYYAAMAYPLLDAAVLAIAGRISASVATQLIFTNVHTLAITGALALTAEVFVGRERPLILARPGYPDFDPDLVGDGDNLSFYSGHMAQAMNSAGLICTHHWVMPLYGSRAGDAVACGFALAQAVAVGTLRITSDRHWATDVLFGAFIGSVTGFLLPQLLHYRFRRTAPGRGGSRSDIVPTLSLTPAPFAGGMVLQLTGAW